MAKWQRQNVEVRIYEMNTIDICHHLQVTMNQYVNILVSNKIENEGQLYSGDLNFLFGNFNAAIAFSMKIVILSVGNFKWPFTVICEESFREFIRYLSVNSTGLGTGVSRFCVSVVRVKVKVVALTGSDVFHYRWVK